MSPMLIAAVSTMMTAAALYTVAVFAERRAGTLRVWHLALFWTGLVFDTTATTLMGRIAAQSGPSPVHGALGVAAIALMLIHSLWASFALVRRKESVLSSFHRFSTTVWGLWMLSLLTGFTLALPKMLAK